MYNDLEESVSIVFDEEMIQNDFTFNKVRVKQVYEAIMENNLEAFDDYGLAKLLCMLTYNEFEVLKTNLVDRLGITARIKLNNIEPLYRFYVEKDLRTIRGKDYYKNYIKALSDGSYIEFFKGLPVEELADLRKLVIFSVDFNDSISISSSKKVYDFIASEIKTRNIKKIA